MRGPQRGAPRGQAPRARYVHQLRIGCLELERARLLVERGAAAQRVQRIDQRLGEIAGEISQHEGCLERLPVTAPALAGTPAEVPLAALGGSAPLRIRY